MILKVGLTGGIASGKSTIARHFAALGAYCIDADALVAHLYRPGCAGHEALIRTYGTDILRPDGEVDRRKLADIAFASPDASRTLNELIHPLVIAEQERLIADESSRFPDRDRMAIVEATLLIESGQCRRFDKLVVVDVDRETQIARGVARGLAREEVIRRIEHQMPREQRLRYGDYVIDNSGDARSAEAATLHVFESLQRDLDAKKKN